MGLLSKNRVTRQGSKAATPGPGPRICMPTFREFTRRAFQCGLYEAQDVLLTIGDVDLICLEQGWGAQVNQSWLRLPLYHDVSKMLMFVNPGLHKVRLTREYDLFVAVCQNYWDLPYLNAIAGWRDQCRTKVCWIDEVWPAEIPGYKHWLHALSQFDYVFVGFSASVGPLSSAIGRTCHWMPGAADLLRFSPYPNPPERVVDVYSIGRRSDGIHHALLRAAEYGRLFYVYDTFRATNTDVFDHREHREAHANMSKRSRFFTVAPARIGDEIARGQVEVGYRYFEGAAAGAVMIGQAPHCEAFRELFGWPDAVIPVYPDGSDIISVLNDLGSDPTRVSAIHRRNAAEALLRHDWVYRWKELLRIAGVDPLPGMVARERRLKELADLAWDDTRMVRQAS